MSVLDGEPVGGTEWRVTHEVRGRDDDVVETVESNAKGEIAVRPGTLHVESSDGKWRTVEGTCRVDPGSLSTIWVAPVGRIEVLVSGTAGRPIPGCTVQWVPASLARSDTTRSGFPERLARTDAMGRAVLEEVPLGPARLWVTQEEWAPVECHLGPAVVSPVLVRMHRANGSARTLRFRTAETGEPLRDIVLRSTGGELVAHSRPGSDEVAVPPWVGPSRVLIAESPGTVTGSFRLADLGGEIVEMRATSYVEVTVRAPSSVGEGALTLTCRVLEAAQGSGEVQPLVPGPLVLRTSDSLSLALPRGLETVVRAVDERGRFAERTVRPLRSTERIELVLAQEAGGPVFRALDPEGRPLLEANWTLLLGDGTAARMRPDTQGRIQAPDGADLRAVRVEAVGYVSVTLDRPAEGWERGGATDIVLHEGVDVVLELRTVEGKELAGMALEVEPSGAPLGTGSGPAASASGRFRRGDARPARIHGATDGLGRYRTTLPPGPAQVSVRLPPALCTDRYGRSSYRVTRTVEVRPTEDPIPIVVEPPVARCLRVQLAESGDPAPRFILTFPPTGEEIEVEGDLWCGWIAEVSGELFVQVPEWGGAAVAVDALEPDQEHLVRVPRDIGTTIVVLDGEGHAVEGEAVIRFYRAERGGGWTICGKYTGALRGGRIELALPSAGEVSVSVEVIAPGGERWVGIPHLTVVVPGGETRVRVAERSGG